MVQSITCRIIIIIIIILMIMINVQKAHRRGSRCKWSHICCSAMRLILLLISMFSEDNFLKLYPDGAACGGIA